MVVLTKRNGIGEHSSNTAAADTKKLVGYTNNTFAKTSGYYNKLSDRCVMLDACTFNECGRLGQPCYLGDSVALNAML